MPSSPVRRLDSGSSEPVGPEDSGSKPESKLTPLPPLPRWPGSCSPRSAGHFSAKPVVGPGSPRPPSAASRPTRSLQRPLCHPPSLPCGLSASLSPSPAHLQAGGAFQRPQPRPRCLPALPCPARPQRKDGQHWGWGERWTGIHPPCYHEESEVQSWEGPVRSPTGVELVETVREERACHHLLPGLISQLVPSAEREERSCGSDGRWQLSTRPGCRGLGRPCSRAQGPLPWGTDLRAPAAGQGVFPALLQAVSWGNRSEAPAPPPPPQFLPCLTWRPDNWRHSASEGAAQPLSCLHRGHPLSLQLGRGKRTAWELEAWLLSVALPGLHASGKVG